MKGQDQDWMKTEMKMQEHEKESFSWCFPIKGIGV